MSEDQNGQYKIKYNGNGNGRVSTYLSWGALIASIALQAGILLTKVNVLSDEAKDLKTTVEAIKIRQLQDGYSINAMQHRLGWLENRYSDIMLKRR